MTTPRQLFRVPTGQDREPTIERVARFLRRLPTDQIYVVSIEQHRPRRSNEQNAYLWGVVYKSILEQGKLEGWTAQDLHEYCLGEWGGWDVMEGFGLKRRVPIRRSSGLNKQEFSDYIEAVKRMMAEHGIVVPEAA